MAPGPKKRGGFRRSNQQQQSKTETSEFDATKRYAGNPAGKDPGAPRSEQSAGSSQFVAPVALEQRENTDFPEITGTNSKKYSKRDVQSNWERYSEKPVQETQPADFQLLLTSSGGVGSQFSFQEEREWSEVLKDSPSEDLLALDASELAKAIQCIPLQERLNIDPDVFPPEQISQFEKAAKVAKDSYIAFKKWPFLKFDDGDIIPASQSVPISKDEKPKIDRKISASLTGETELPTKKVVSSDDVINTLVNCIKINESQSADLNQKTNISEKDELDFLLSLGATSQLRNKPLGNIQSGTLGLNLQHEEEGSSSNLLKAPMTKCEKKGDSSLDEWLDSVLQN